MIGQCRLSFRETAVIFMLERAQCRMMHAVSIEKKREGQVMGATQNFAYDF